MNIIIAFLLATFISSNYSQDQTTTLIGSFGEEFSDTLYVQDLMHTPSSQEVIIVTNGEFKFTTATKCPDIRLVTNKSMSIAFNFITYPGEYNVTLQNGSITIEGELNKKLNTYHAEVTALMIEREMTLHSNDPKEIKDQKLNALKEKTKSVIYKLAEAYNNTPIATACGFAAHILVGKDLPFFNSIFSFIDEEALNCTALGQFIASLKNRYDNPKGIPELELYTSNSEIKKLKAPEKYLYIDFWASWCKPCRKKIPALVEVYNKYETSNLVEFLSISIDDNQNAWLKAIEKEQMPWEQLNVKDKANHEKLKLHWGVTSVPHGVLIDKEQATVKNYIKEIQELDSLLNSIISH